MEQAGREACEGAEEEQNEGAIGANESQDISSQVGAEAFYLRKWHQKSSLGIMGNDLHGGG